MPSDSGASRDLRQEVLDKAQELADMSAQRHQEAAWLTIEGQRELGRPFIIEGRYFDELSKLLALVAGELA